MQLMLKIPKEKDVLSAFSAGPIHINEKFGDVRINGTVRLEGAHLGQGQICIILDRDEFIQIGVSYRNCVDRDLAEIPQLITSGAGVRKIRERVQHWKEYWGVSNEKILDSLQGAESPLEILRREFKEAVNVRPKILERNRGLAEAFALNLRPQEGSKLIADGTQKTTKQLADKEGQEYID